MTCGWCGKPYLGVMHPRCYAEWKLEQDYGPKGTPMNHRHRITTHELDRLETARERAKATAAAIFAAVVLIATLYLTLWSLTH
jgi:hypothetical protein